MGKSELSNRAYLIGFCLILMFAAILRFAVIDKASMDPDEMGTVFDVKCLPYDGSSASSGKVLTTYGGEYEKLNSQALPSWSSIWASVRRQEFNPPLYFLLLSSWMDAFGVGPVQVRSLSVIFGLLSILVTGLAAAYLVNRRAGLLAALVLSILPMHFIYSLDARPYALSMLTGAVSLLLFAKTMRERTLKWAALLGVSYAFGLYSHYFFAFVIFAQCLYVLICSDRAKLIKLQLLACGVGSLLFAPWIPSLVHQMPSDVSVYGKPGWGRMLFSLANTLSCLWLGEVGGLPRPFKIACLVALMGILISGFAWAMRHKDCSPQIVAWNGLISFLLPLLFIVKRSPILAYVRYYSVFIPAIVVALVWASLSLRREIRAVVLILLVPAALLGTGIAWMKPENGDMRMASRFIAHNVSQQGLVIADTAPSGFSYYTPGHTRRMRLMDSRAVDQLSATTKNESEICSVFIGWGTVPYGEVNHWLEKHFDKVKEQSNSTISVVLYRRHGPPNR